MVARDDVFSYEMRSTEHQNPQNHRVVFLSKDTKLRFCNLQLEHATEKTESMACRGNLKQLEMKLQTVLRSEHQCVQDYQREAEALQFLSINTKGYCNLVGMSVEYVCAKKM